MNIGFFGDSYVDVFLYDPLTDQRSWSYKLLEDFSSPIISSGNAGTSQFHAIQEWEKFKQSKKDIDVAIWTFTWDNRLFNSWQLNQIIFAAAAEKRHNEIREVYKNTVLNPDDPEMVNNLLSAHDLYQRYVYDQTQSEFLYSLMLKWILDLPKSNKNIKFIFIPNTELANSLSKELFHTGVLLDFAFETLSNAEIEAPEPMPVNCGRVGHINNANINHFKNLISDIIKNYQSYENKIYKVDYDKFEIKK